LRVGYTEGLVDGLRQTGDPSADAVIEEMAHADQVRTVSDVLRSLTYNDQPVPAELPASIGRWLDEHGELPDWVDRDRLERGSAVVVEHGPQVCVALATASLVYCYAGYPGVKVLTFSRRLGHDADRRVGETAQFVLAVMAPGSLDPCGRGIRKIQKVRLLHAAIRHLVTGSGRWDVAADGIPICQEDLLGTLLSFSWIVVDSLRKLGVRIDDQEAEDYHYRWRVIGQMLGIQPAAIPADLAEAAVVTWEIARRNHRRSDEGMLMTRALFALHANSLPAGFEGAAPALTRYLLGEDVCALVGLPRSRWDRAMTWQASVGRVLDRAQSARGPVGSLTKMVGAGILTQRVVGMAGRNSASFSIPVPPELHRRWTASGVFPSIDPELIEIAQAQQA
jgi:ER-bound oxygenase mpaB/B'/Rubber oxygenase, catalytic domain